MCTLVTMNSITLNHDHLIVRKFYCIQESTSISIVENVICGQPELQ